MKIPKRLLILMFSISLILNAIFLPYYFLKLKPEVTALKNLQKNIETTDINQPTCNRVYSVSKKAFVCLEYTRTEALSKCSELTTTSVDKSNTSIESWAKTREALMKVCMEAKGFDY